LGYSVFLVTMVISISAIGELLLLPLIFVLTFSFGYIFDFRLKVFLRKHRAKTANLESPLVVSKTA